MASNTIRASPSVEVQLHELATDAQIRKLRAARLDLSIGPAPVDEPDIGLESVLREELVLAAPAEGPTGEGDCAVDLRALSEASFIVPPRELAPGALRADHQPLPRGWLCTDDHPACTADADRDRRFPAAWGCLWSPRPCATCSLASPFPLPTSGAKG
jgi:DNA-binding transcriptional LysR family regulator